MIEIWAAVCGASITIAGVGVTGLNRQAQQSRESIVRLTEAVENLTKRLDAMHEDMRKNETMVASRLGLLETSVARLEAHNDLV